jgi:ATP-dependent Clp protease ATP-binding subunit ClpB
VDEILMFRPLSREDLEKIVELQLGRLGTFLADREARLHVSPAARRIITDAGYDPMFGARPVKRAIQRLVSDPLALAFLDGRFEDGDSIVADSGESGTTLEFRKAEEGP